MRAIKSCDNLPLAVALIGGLQLQTIAKWKNAISVIESKDIHTRRGSYDFNLYGTFTLSLQQLDDEKRELFRLLGVYGQINIPVKSIMTLWKWDEYSTINLLEELNSKSLLKYVAENE